MNELLSPVIAAYIESGNVRNEDAFAACFAANAVVIDENATHRGEQEIRAWYRRTRDEYDFTAEVKSFTQTSNEAVVVCTVSGNFPGSPVDLSYEFKIENDKIAELTIL